MKNVNSIDSLYIYFIRRHNKSKDSIGFHKDKCAFWFFRFISRWKKKLYSKSHNERYPTCLKSNCKCILYQIFRFVWLHALYNVKRMNDYVKIHSLKLNIRINFTNGIQSGIRKSLVHKCSFPSTLLFVFFINI